MAVAAASALLVAVVPLSAQAIPSAGADAGAPVADGPVYAIAHAPGGNTYIGGEFSHVGTRSGRGVALASPGGAASVQGPAPGASNFPEVSGGEIKAVEPDGAGGWFIGGTFTHVGGASIPRLAHIRDTGEVNTSWRPAPTANTGSPAVLALAVARPTGTSGPVLYVGGDFRSVGAQNRDFLAAFTMDASTAAPIGTGAPNGWAPVPSEGGAPVRALDTANLTLNTPTPEPQPVVFVGGDFTKIGAGTPDAINRVGAIWGVGARGADNTLKPDDADSDPDQLAGREADMGGATNNEFWNPGMAATVRTIVASSVQPTAGGDTVVVYIGGDFTGADEERLSAYQFQVNGAGNVTGQQSFANWDAIVDAPVNALALRESAGDSILYAGGTFSNARQGGNANQPRARLAAFRGIPATNFGATPCPIADCGANVLNWQPDPDNSVNALTNIGGAVVAGGRFTSIGAATPQNRAGVAAVDPNSGAVIENWDPRLAGGPVNALAADSDSVYAGGAFSMVGAEKRNNLAAIGPGGSILGFGPGTGCGGGHPCSSGEVRALALSPDLSRLFVGGAFTHVGADRRIHLAALDAQSGNAIPDWVADADRVSGASDPGWVLSLEGAGNTLYAGGAFTRVGGVARSRIAAINMGTGAVESWQPDATCTSPDSCNVHAVEASCGTVYAGGNFDAIGGAARKNLAALQPFGVEGAGQATSWVPNPTEQPGVVRDLARVGTTVYAGGNFAVLGGKVRQRIAALDAGNASAIEGWNPTADGDVHAIDVSEDGLTFYAGGIFPAAGGANRQGLAAIEAVGVGDGSGNALAWNPGPGAPLASAGASFPGTYAIDAVGDSVYAGGEFGEVGPRTQSGFAAFTSGPDPAAGAPEVCPHEVAAAEPPAAAPLPAPEVPRITKVKLTRKLMLLYRLTLPATVEIDVDRKLRGFEVPVKGGKEEKAKAPGDQGDRPPPKGDEETVCKPPSKRVRGQALASVKERLGKKLKRLSPRKRQKLIRKRLRKLRCPMLKSVSELTDEGEKGKNKVSLRKVPISGKKKPQRLRAGRYRLTLLPVTAATGPGKPVGLDFRVLKNGLAKVSRGKGDEGTEGKPG